MPSVAYKGQANTVFVSGDWHLGEHDPRAIAAFLIACRDMQPDGIYLNGDILDMTSFQKVNRQHTPAFEPGANPLPFMTELVQCNMLLAKLREACPNAQICFIEGNHEARIGRLLTVAMPQIFGMVPPLSAMLGLDELSIDYVSSKEILELGDFIITHGQRCNMHAGKSAMLDDWGQSVVMGHTHRLKMYSKGYGTGRKEYGVEAGHLRNVGASYTPRRYPDWQQGWAVLTERRKGVYEPTLIPVDSGTATFPGKLYYARQRDVDRLFGPIKERLTAQAEQLVADIVNGNLWRE